MLITTILATAALGGIQDTPWKERPTDAILANARRLASAVAARDRGRTDFSLLLDDRHVSGQYGKLGWSGRLSTTCYIIARPDGTIRSFGISTNQAEELACIEATEAGLSREEALEASREYLEVMHPGIGFEPFIVKRHGRSGYGTSKFPRNAYWEIQAMPMIGTRPLLYTSSVLLNIDCDRGQLIKYSGGALPRLDLAEAPVVPMEQGERAILDAYARHQPFARGRIRMTWLAVGCANFAGPNEMTAEHRRLAEEDMAIPLYVCHIDDVAELNPETGMPGHFQVVFADARDGHVLGIVDQWPFGEPNPPSPSSPRWRLGEPVALAGTAASAPLVLGAIRPGSWEGTSAVLRQGVELWHVVASRDGRTVRFPGDSSEWQTGPELAQALVARPHRPPFGSR